MIDRLSESLQFLTSHKGRVVIEIQEYEPANIGEDRMVSEPKTITLDCPLKSVEAPSRLKLELNDHSRQSYHINKQRGPNGLHIKVMSADQTTTAAQPAPRETTPVQNLYTYDPANEKYTLNLSKFGSMKHLHKVIHELLQGKSNARITLHRNGDFIAQSPVIFAPLVYPLSSHPGVSFAGQANLRQQDGMVAITDLSQGLTLEIETNLKGTKHPGMIVKGNQITLTPSAYGHRTELAAAITDELKLKEKPVDITLETAAGKRSLKLKEIIIDFNGLTFKDVAGNTYDVGRSILQDPETRIVINRVPSPDETSAVGMNPRITREANMIKIIPSEYQSTPLLLNELRSLSGIVSTPDYRPSRKQRVVLSVVEGDKVTSSVKFYTDRIVHNAAKGSFDFMSGNKVVASAPRNLRDHKDLELKIQLAV